MQVLVSIEGLLEPGLCPEGPDGPQALERRGQVGEHRTASCRTMTENQCLRSTLHTHTHTHFGGALTGGLEALDVPGGLQEVAAQEDEDEEQRQHRDDDPGDHGHGHADHPDDLEEHLRTGNTAWRSHAHLLSGTLLLLFTTARLLRSLFLQSFHDIHGHKDSDDNRLIRGGVAGAQRLTWMKSTKVHGKLESSWPTSFENLFKTRPTGGGES